MFDQQTIQQLARELHESERSRGQVERFSRRFPGMTHEDGYAVSRAWVAMKSDEPDYGTLLDDMFFVPGDIPTPRFIAPRVQGHPAIGVAWLARKLAPWGEGLQAGEVVLAGSFTRPVPAQRGDAFDADYGPLGRFTFTFT
jgi:2-keto-4-pentenoate hydratase